MVTRESEADSEYALSGVVWIIVMKWIAAKLWELMVAQWTVWSGYCICKLFMLRFLRIDAQQTHVFIDQFSNLWWLGFGGDIDRVTLLQNCVKESFLPKFSLLSTMQHAIYFLLPETENLTNTNRSLPWIHITLYIYLMPVHFVYILHVVKSAISIALQRVAQLTST